MHVVQLIDSLDVGGAETLQVTFAEAARTRHIPLTVISLRDTTGTPKADQLRSLGARVLVFPSRKVYDPERFWRLATFLRRERSDVLHTHLTHANILGALIGRLSGIPVIATLHSTGVEPRRYNPLWWHLETQALRYGARRVVAVGYRVAEIHRQRLGDKPIEVIPNAMGSRPSISPEERVVLRREMVGDSSRPLLISVGRLVLPKGYPDLVNAFAALHRTHPATALAIAGDGPLRTELEAQIAALKLDGHVFLLGIRYDVPRLLTASDLYVSASHWEGLPMAVLEAMAAGLPVVATSVGDVPQVIVKGTGVVIPPKEPTGLAAALRSLLDDPTRMQSLGMAAQAHVIRNYSPAVWLDRLLRLYQEVVGPSGAFVQTE